MLIGIAIAAGMIGGAIALSALLFRAIQKRSGS